MVHYNSMIYHKYALTFQFAQEKTKRKEELKCLGFFKVFERGEERGVQCFLTPGASQGFFLLNILVETMNL